MKIKFFIITVCVFFSFAFLNVQLAQSLEEGDVLPEFGGDQTLLVPFDDSIFLFDILLDSQILEEEGTLNDLNLITWKYDHTNPDVLEAWEEVPIVEKPDVIRDGMALANTSDKAYFFGGIGEDDNGNLVGSNGLWEYDKNTAIFREIDFSRSVAGSFPTARVDALAHVIGDALFVVSGRTQDDQISKEVWKFDINTETWELLSDEFPVESFDFEPFGIGVDPENPDEFLETQIMRPSMFILEETLFVLGKDSDVNSNNFALWKMSLLDNVWEELTENPGFFVPDYVESYASAQSDTAFFLFGGMSRDEVFSKELFTFNGLVFTPINTEEGPSARSESNMIFTDNSLHVFGGISDNQGGGFFNEIWKLDLDSLTWEDRSLEFILEDLPDEEDVIDDRVFRSDVLIQDPVIEVSTNISGKRVRCSLRKKDRIRTRGFARMHFAFLEGSSRGVVVDAKPVITLTQDNNLTFQAVVKPGPGRRIVDTFWQVEGVRDSAGKPFVGFNRDFFEEYITSEGLSISLTKSNTTQPDITYNTQEMNTVGSFDPSTLQPENFGIAGDKLVVFNQLLPPGKHRIHLTSVIRNFEEFGNRYAFNVVGSWTSGACGKRRRIRPEAYNMPFPEPIGPEIPKSVLPYYYVTHVYEVDVPEVQNFADVLSIDTEVNPVNLDENFLKPGFLTMNWNQPPNILNAMKPVFIAEHATPNSQIIPMLGEVSVAGGNVLNSLALLNSNPFERVGSLGNNLDYFNMMSQILTNLEKNFSFPQFADRNGRFTFQPLNILPLNSEDGIKNYKIHFVTIAPTDSNSIGYNIVGAPPVKFSILQDEFLPRLYNINSGDMVVSPRPVFMGSGLPNTLYEMKLNNDTVFHVRVGYDGNFVFTLPEDLNEGENTLQFFKSENSNLLRELRLNFDKDNTQILPELVSHVNGTAEFSGFPTFQVVYKPNTILQYRLNKNDVVEFITDEKGHAVVDVEGASLCGTLSAQTTNCKSFGERKVFGSHQIEFFVKNNPNKVVQADFKIFDTPQISGQSDFEILSSGDPVVLIDGGDVLVDNQVRMFIEKGGRIRVVDDNVNINLPSGVLVYFAKTGLVQTLQTGGVVSLEVGDEIVLSQQGGQVWVADLALKNITVPVSTTIVAAQDNARFTYNDRGEIYFANNIVYNGEEVKTSHIEDYFFTPHLIDVRVSNYMNGDTVDSLRPFFEGRTIPFSQVEMWMKNVSNEEAQETLIANVKSDFHGRFVLRTLENLEPGNEYEFAFINRNQQGPTQRMILQVPENTPEFQGEIQHTLLFPDLGADEKNYNLQYNMQQKLPTRWIEAIW